MKLIPHVFAGALLVSLATVPYPHTTDAAVAPPLTKIAVQKMIDASVASQLKTHDDRIKNNLDFDPNNPALQPYYLPVMANSDFGTILTVGTVSAKTGNFSSGITTLDTETGQPFCITVQNGTIALQDGSC
jgi:hypothetical protein